MNNPKLDRLLRRVMFRNAPLLLVAPPERCPVVTVEGLHTLVVYRGRETQVELVVVAPNVTIPPHSHPNVDSYEVYVGGDVMFYLEGQPMRPQHKPFKEFVRVLPGQVHAAQIGPRGGSFLSIQHWQNGVTPTAVGLDWADGRTMGPSHEKQMRK